MSLNHFLENTFHLMRNIPEHDAGGYWENFMAQYDNFRLHQPHKTHHLGLPNNIQLEQTPIVFQEWLNSNPGVHVFHFVSLKAHQKISHTLSDISENTQKTLHMLPDTDLNYGRFKEELWDLHLEGYQVFFHYTNEVKTFAKNTELFQRLANRGVSVGISANWSPTWLGNDIQKIRGLINELGVHFFNTEFIAVGSESFTKEQENQQQILQLNI